MPRKIVNISGIWWASDMLMNHRPLPFKCSKIEPEISETFQENLDRRMEELKERLDDKMQ